MVFYAGFRPFLNQDLSACSAGDGDVDAAGATGEPATDSGELDSARDHDTHGEHARGAVRACDRHPFKRYPCDRWGSDECASCAVCTRSAIDGWEHARGDADQSSAHRTLLLLIQ